MAVAQPETYLADLNPAQREAVLHTEGPLLVVAGAGSGKTRVLTYRVAHLLAHGGRQAERDPRDHVHEPRGGGDARPARAPPRRHRAPDLDPDLPLRVRPHAPPRGRADRAALELLDLRPGRPGAAREADPGGRGLRPEAVRPARHPRADLEREEPARSAPTSTASRVSSFYDQTVAEVYERYQKRLHASNAVDFDDMLYLTVEIFERFPEARERWQKAFRYVLVDEYQDTNHAQYRLLQLLAEQHRNVCAVGDPDQSIYAFRGADIRNVLEFERDFPGARTIALEQNYRSTNHILGAANGVISHNRERKEKNLWSELGDGEAVRVVEVEDEHAEARLRRGRDRGPRRGGRQRRRDRGLLPDERAVARARGHPRPAGRRVRRPRRPALLRARRGQGRRRLPPGDRQPVRRRLARADREPAAPRDRRHDARPAAEPRRRARHLAVGGHGRPRGRRAARPPRRRR